MEWEKEENWMEELLLDSPNPVLKIGREGTVLYANKAGKTLLEEFKTQVGEKAPVELLDLCQRAGFQGKSEEMEFKAGNRIYSITLAPLKKDGSLSLFALDITRLKKTEEQLFLKNRESEVLSKIAEFSLKTQDFELLLEKILALLVTAFDAEYFSILKLLPDGDFALEAGIGWKPDYRGRKIKKDLVLRAGNIEFLDEPVFMEKLNKNGFVREMGLGQDVISGINVLIGTQEKPYGVLAAYSTKKEKFTEEEGHFLNSVAMILSLIFERKMAEEILRSELNFLETLLDTIPAPVFYKDRKGRYMGCNEFFAKMILGRSKEKIIGSSIDELSDAIPSNLGETYKRMDSQLLQKGGDQVYESKVMCSDGAERDFVFNKATYRNFCGEVKGLVGVMLDITGRKIAEEKLQKSEERYRLIAEQTGQLICDIDLKSGKVEWAGAIRELTGYSYKEIENLNLYDWLEHIHPEDRRRVKQAFKRSWNTGEKFHEEFRFQRKDGSYIYVENKGIYLRDEEGSVCRALGAMKDVTEIKLSSEKLKESEELYRSFLQNFRGIAFKMDKNFTPLLVEGAVKEITGYTEEEFISGEVKLLDLINLEDKQMVKECRRKLRISSGSVIECEYKLKRRNGAERWVHEIIHNVFENAGEIAFIQGYAYDITERKKAREALAKAEEIGMRETHHRIKNNLQIVSSLLNLQADKFKDKDVKEAFRESENRVASMSIIHEELYKSANATSIDFAAYLKKLTADLLSSYRVGDEKIQLFLDVEDNTFLGIDTAIPLGIIINELVSNSLKYAFPKKEGEIRVSLQKVSGSEVEDPASTYITGKESSDAANRYKLIYSDNGARFPKNVDFRNSETLGLQLINALVEQIDGTIKLEIDKETRFTLEFEEKKVFEGS